MTHGGESPPSPLRPVQGRSSGRRFKPGNCAGNGDIETGLKHLYSRVTKRAKAAAGEIAGLEPNCLPQASPPTGSGAIKAGGRAGERPAASYQW